MRRTVLLDRWRTGRNSCVMSVKGEELLFLLDENNWSDGKT